MDTVKGFLAGPRAQAAFNTVTNTPYILPIVMGALAIIILVVIVIVAYQYGQNRPGKFILGPVDLFKPESVVIVDRLTTLNQMSGSYTLSFYIRIDAVPDMRNGATPLIIWPGIWELMYNPAEESASLIFSQTRDQATTAPTPDTVTIPGLPLQRWTQVTVTMAGRTVDVYLNGALAHSAQLQNLPQSAQSSIVLHPNLVMGQLAYIQVWSRRLLVGEVAANYTDTSDSQGRPFLGVGFLSAFSFLKVPNLFCPSGNCNPTTPTAPASQHWEFPYA